MLTPASPGCTDPAQPGDAMIILATHSHCSPQLTIEKPSDKNAFATPCNALIFWIYID